MENAVTVVGVGCALGGYVLGVIMRMADERRVREENAELRQFVRLEWAVRGSRPAFVSEGIRVRLMELREKWREELGPKVGDMVKLRALPEDLEKDQAGLPGEE